MNRDHFLKIRVIIVYHLILQVHIETGHCGGGAYCVCGVAVRVGKDVFQYDLCGIDYIRIDPCEEGFIDVRIDGSGYDVRIQ